MGVTAYLYKLLFGLLLKKYRARIWEFYRACIIIGIAGE